MQEQLVEFNGGTTRREAVGLDRWCPPAALDQVRSEPQRSIPAIARNEAMCAEIEASLGQVPTSHRLLLGDSRKLDDLPDESIHLVVTSPPYWTLKDYEPGDGQLGYVEDYEEFNRALAVVWEHCYRLLVPGGRLVINVGDVLLPRRKVGRHLVYPLHSTITEHCRHLGFDTLTPLIWHKIANAKFEAGGGSILGKPYEPNGIIKSNIEWILFQRKPGGYRKPTPAHRILSVIPQPRHQAWFQSIWNFGGASTKQHPAPFPVELPTRLIRMFSFVGDTVLDPFSGTASTSVAAAAWGRDSVGIEVEPLYFGMASKRLNQLAHVDAQLPLPGAGAGSE